MGASRINSTDCLENMHQQHRYWSVSRTTMATNPSSVGYLVPGSCLGPGCRFLRSVENSTLVTSMANSTLPLRSTNSEVPEGKKVESGNPVVSAEQINRIANIVLQALHSQDCLQRLMCETGSVAKSMSWTDAITDLIVPWVPKSGVSTFLIFKQGKKCERFTCDGDKKV